MNTTDKPIQSGLHVSSWIILFATVVLVVYVAREMIHQSRELTETVAVDEVDIPLATRLVVDAPKWGIEIAAGAVILLLGLKEVLLPWKLVRLSINIAVFVGLFLVLEAYRQAVLDVLLQFF